LGVSQKCFGFFEVNLLSMRKIDSLSSASGRLILQEIFRELKYKKQLGSLSLLLNCWKICVYETDLTKYIKTETTVMHRLGFFRGTRIWMEEIVNRFYYSAINSFVYFGAAVLLIVIGIRRFSDAVDDRLVIAGVVFEAAMLFFMFIVMLFSPGDDEIGAAIDEDQESQKDELLTEIGEIAKDFAQTSVTFENISDELSSISAGQSELVSKLDNIANNLELTAKPNIEMLGEMQQINNALAELRNTIIQLNESTRQLRKEEIELTVRKQLESIISNSILNSNNAG